MADEHGEQTGSAGGTFLSMSGSAEVVVQAGNVNGGVHFGVPEKAPRSTPRQLPADTASFTGRGSDIARLRELAEDRSRRSRGTVAVSVIDGMAGIGKTALAVHAGHQLAEHFPDGQLFVDLHGYTDGLAPREPADALAIILRSYGVLPQQLPADLDARAAFYRDRLAGTRTLVVLDNAATEAQVRPLLPADPRCLVLVTSRRRLKALDDADTTTVELLPTPEAVRLFRRVAGGDHGNDHGHDRGGADGGADGGLIDEIVALCGRLPLALRIAAALIRHRPAWSLARLVEKLRDGGAGIAGFSDTGRDLAAVFDLSYHALTEEQRVFFRFLGLIPGPETDPYATAALLDVDWADAERLLEDLVDHNLLLEPSAGRYRMHDLLRRHARALAERDAPWQRDTAVERLLNYYRQTAARAGARIALFRGQPPIEPPPASAPDFTQPNDARAWLRAERANLEACLEHVSQRGLDNHIIALTGAIASLLRRDGPWPAAISLHIRAMAAAVRLGDRPGQAAALTDLARVRSMTGDYPGATRDHQDALRLFRELGDDRGQAHVLRELGHIRWMTGDYPGATRDLYEVLHRYRGLGERAGQADVLLDLGEVRRMTGDYEDAARHHGEAFELFRELGDDRGQAHALTLLGEVRTLRGDHAAAARDLEQALRIHQDLDSRFFEANTLTYLGDVRAATGDYPGALRDVGKAVEVFRDLGVRINEAWALNHYAALFLATDEPRRALELYRDALRLSREVTQPDDEGLALEGIGMCLLRPEIGREANARDAAAHLNQASEIFHRLGMRPEIERVDAVLGEIDPS